jgi:hypothetical protein
VLGNDQEKIKLEEEAISKILVADTDWESGAEASDVEDNFQEEEEEEEEEEGEEEEEEKEEEDDDNNNKPQQKSKHRLQQVMDYQPGDCLKEGTQILIHLSVLQKM